MVQDHNIYDNHNRGILQNFFRNQIDENTKASFVSAYFTVHAYYTLKEEFDKLKQLRFLFGEPNFVQRVSEFLEYRNAIIEDEEIKIPLDQTIKQSVKAKACVDWIRKKVEIRSIKKPNFLHGKAYILENQGRIPPTAVIGSSNFTYKGLGCGKSPNMELNLKLNDSRDVNEVLSWFNEVWSDKSKVEDVKEEVIKSIEQLYKDNTPEFIYYKTLYHIFDDFLKEEDDKIFQLENKHLVDSQIWKTLYDFQKDAVRGIINRINKYGGCILADSVGLGKTFEALAVIKHFEIKFQKVLVLCPKKLKENWNQYRYTYKNNILEKDNFHYAVLSHTDLTRESGRAGDIELSKFAWEGYDLIVIDESHNFRNSKKESKDSDDNKKFTRYGRLLEEVLKPGVNTKVLLLSATPVNNDLSDLKSQLNLIFKDDENSFREMLNINGIDYILKSAQSKFNKWTEKKTDNIKNSIFLTDVIDNEFFKLLDHISIARSRKHIIAKYEKSLKEVGSFPIKLKPISVSTDIDITNQFPNYDTLYKQIAEFKLHLYKPAQYVNNDFKDEYDIKFKRKDAFDNQATSEKFLTMMMRINYLKRLESSIDSFRSSIFRTINKYTETIDKIENYDDLKNKDIFEELDFQLDFDEAEDEKQVEIEENLTIGKKLKYRLKHFDRERYLSALKNDKDALVKLYEKADKITPDRDAKLQRLKELISYKMKSPLNKENKKVLIFTAFADTADYLYENLNTWAKKNFSIHSALISGGNKGNKSTLKFSNDSMINKYEDILVNFSPISKNRRMFITYPQEQIDLLIATDCISEGQNLQDCDYMINYDIHWNPVRIIQRFGRIDRIGSKNKDIQMVNFWPTDDLDKYIKLKNRVENRMRLVDLTGAGSNSIADEEVNSIDEKDFRLQLLEKLKSEVLSPDDSDASFSLTDFSLQDFRIDLTNFIEKNRQELKDAPLGLYSIVPPLSSKLSRVEKNLFNNKVETIIQPGVIFCLKHKHISKTNRKTLDKLNPISPYYLIYILESGDVRFNFTNSKQILDIYNLLCKGESKIYESLCDIFNKEAEVPDYLNTYTELLKKSCNIIMDKTKSLNAQDLTKNRNAQVLNQNVMSNYLNDFELITWLIIKEN